MKKYLNKEFLLSNKDNIVKGAIIAVLVITAFITFILGAGSGKNEEIIVEADKEVIEESEESNQTEIIMVDVCGAVKEPQVVQLPAESRVTDAIAAAGGLTDKADTAKINQAAFLMDGEKIYVPEIGEDISGLDLDSGGSYSFGKVNINTANSEELQTLNGVGPATAEKILQYRSDVGYFKSIEDLKNVNGIGDKTFENLKEYIKV